MVIQVGKTLRRSSNPKLDYFSVKVKMGGVFLK